MYDINTDDIIAEPYSLPAWNVHREELTRLCKLGATSSEIYTHFGFSYDRQRSMCSIVRRMGLSDIWKTGRAYRIHTRPKAIVPPKYKKKPHTTQNECGHYAHHDGLHGMPVSIDTVLHYLAVCRVDVVAHGGGFLFDGKYLPNKGYLIAHTNIIRSRNIKTHLRLR